MPGIDGLGLCERIKQEPRSEHVPVLLITSLSDRAVRLRGIAAGANDFLLKPIDTQDIALRVRNAVHLKRLLDCVRESYSQLRRSEDMRDSLVHMVVHDLRSPLFAIRLYLESFLREGREAVDPELAADIDRSFAISGSMMEMISSILDISRFESGEMPLVLEPCDLKGLCEDAIEPVRALARGRTIVIDVQGGSVVCDCGLIRRVVSNLVTNSFKYSPKDSQVTVTGRVSGGIAEISVADSGPGVPERFHQRIFEKFGSLGSDLAIRPYSTGLGLPFCKLAVEAHGGSIAIANIVADGAPRGSRFWFTIPVTPAPRPLGQVKKGSPWHTS